MSWAKTYQKRKKGCYWWRYYWRRREWRGLTIIRQVRHCPRDQYAVTVCPSAAFVVIATKGGSPHHLDLNPPLLSLVLSLINQPPLTPLALSLIIPISGPSFTTPPRIILINYEAI